MHLDLVAFMHPAIGVSVKTKALPSCPSPTLFCYRAMYLLPHVRSTLLICRWRINMAPPSVSPGQDSWILCRSIFSQSSGSFVKRRYGDQNWKLDRDRPRLRHLAICCDQRCDINFTPVAGDMRKLCKRLTKSILQDSLHCFSQD
jgi:hypothetical protein